MESHRKINSHLILTGIEFDANLDRFSDKMQLAFFQYLCLFKRSNAPAVSIAKINLALVGFGKFGKKYYRNIDLATNSVGIIWDDKYAQDDILTEQTMYVVKGTPVKLIIGSRDVIHDVGLSHFRLKMDAVPGIPTTMWFTPKFTTAEMKEKTGNPNFAYEISCDQMCGNGHYSMKGIIEVVDQEEYDMWMAKQKPQYFTAFPEKDPTAVPVAAAADTTAKASTAKM